MRGGGRVDRLDGLRIAEPVDDGRIRGSPRKVLECSRYGGDHQGYGDNRSGSTQAGGTRCGLLVVSILMH